MRARIVEAAKSILVRKGLTGWTVDAVAREAGCAKGLIHYHHRSKAALLAAAATSLRSDRIARRAAAFERRGTRALDALWTVLAAEVASGECSAWLGLVTTRDREVRAALRPSADELEHLAAAVEGALEVAHLSPATVRVLLAALDGMQVPLLLGDPPETVREAYDRFWLAAL
jgi:AcrR family transcriptional regulator